MIVNCLTVFSQEKYTQHTVAKGETISGIAKKYNKKSSEIYELNPDARNGIKYKTVLLIPSKAKKNSVSTSNITNNFPESPSAIMTLHEIDVESNDPMSMMRKFGFCIILYHV